MKHQKTVFIVLLLLVMAGCGRRPDLTKKPIDTIIRDHSDVENFSIILYDMDTEGTFFKKYNHQYRIITINEDGEPEEEITGWYEVGKDYFMYHIDNMGMEIAAKEDGKVEKNVSPPGYGSYVGNARYGHWVSRGGSSFWEFYGQYAFMSSMFNLMAYPIRRSYWNDYRTNYYGTGRVYYGPSATGSYMYGTRGTYNSGRTSSRWVSNTSNNSLRQRVRGSTARSSRSGSRYSTSSRSRSGSYGK
jgi:hypothetical protein